MKTLHLGMIAVFGFIIFFLSPSDSYASTCAVKETIYSAPQFFLLSDSVFSGTVTSITDYGNHQWQVHFDIEKIWKGVATRQTSTVMTGTLQACGYSIAVGEKYLIYTNGSPSFINPIDSKMYSDAQNDIALFDDPKFQSQEKVKEDLNKKLEVAQERVGSIMIDKSSHIPISAVGVDQVNSTLDIVINDQKATLSLEQYRQSLQDILGDIPIKVEFGYATTSTPILHSVNDQGQTTSNMMGKFSFTPQNQNQTGRNLGPPTIPSVIESPLKQSKSGIAAKDVQCIDDFTLVIKSEDGTPVCITPETAEKLIERGWAYQEIPSKNKPHEGSTSTNTTQTLVIGTDTYDIREFLPVAGNTVYLGDLKFVYEGRSPLNNSCYPELVNQTQARDFEIVSNETDMHTNYCWPPINYPQNMTKQNVLPHDLFSRYSIGFFDNQTMGIGWCHLDSCEFGKMFYLVKKGWNAPIVYDSPSNLEFHLATNASVISTGQAIGINMSTNNKLSNTILVPNKYNFSFNGTGLGPCYYGPFKLAIFKGFFEEGNFTHGTELQMYKSAMYSCAPPSPAKGYKFEPASDTSTPRCSPFFWCGWIEQMRDHVFFSGYWENTSFHQFENGTYTIIAGDEWGNHSIKHFTVITNRN